MNFKSHFFFNVFVRKVLFSVWWIKSLYLKNIARAGEKSINCSWLKFSISLILCNILQHWKIVSFNFINDECLRINFKNRHHFECLCRKVHFLFDGFDDYNYRAFLKQRRRIFIAHFITFSNMLIVYNILQYRKIVLLYFRNSQLCL